MWIAGSIEHADGHSDMLVMRTNQDGTIAFARGMGTEADEIVFEIYPTADGGCLFSAVSASNDAPAGAIADSAELRGFEYPVLSLIVRMDAAGQVLRSHVLGVQEADAIREFPARPKVAMLPDGGYVVAVATRRTSGATREDLWISRFDAEGRRMWERMIRNEKILIISRIVADDAGVWVAGLEHSNVKEGADGILFRLNLDGDVTWGNRYAFDGADEIRHLIPGSDGELLVVVNEFGASRRILGRIDRHGQWLESRIIETPGVWANLTGFRVDRGIVLTGTMRGTEHSDHDAWVTILPPNDVDSLPAGPNPREVASVDVTSEEAFVVTGEGVFPVYDVRLVRSETNVSARD
jgi:hypothetical protein